MDARRAALLEPVLRRDRPVDAGYSLQASFWIAFFGGAFAALALSFLNARAWGRAKQDAWAFGLAFAAAVAWTAASTWLRLTGAVPEEHSWWLTRFAPRAFGLLVWGAFFLLHRSMYRGQALSDQPTRKPWGAALLCIGFGIAMVFPIAYGVRELLR